MTWESCFSVCSESDVFGQLFDKNGTKIGNEFRANSYTNDYQMHPSVASLNNGNFVVTWVSDGQDGSSYGIYGQLFYGNGTTIGREFRANTYTTLDQNAPSITNLSNGNFVVTWSSREQDGSDWGIFAQLFDKNGTKIGNETQVNNFTVGTQIYPAVASFPNGNFVVTWDSFLQDGSGFGVYDQLFDGNGTKIGNESQVNTYTNFSQWRSSVASFSNGNFVVTWQSDSQDSSGYGIFGHLFDGNGTKIGREFQVNTYTNFSQWRSSVASFSNGNFVVTWDSYGQDGSSYGIYGQLFYGNGTTIGREFRANTYTMLSQQNPSVVSLVDGRFVVTWQSLNQDGSDYGIYGQIFDDKIMYPSSTSTTSSSTMSKPLTTYFTTHSVSSSTTFAFGRTRTSMNSSSSSTRNSAPSISRPTSTSNSRTTFSTSDSNHRFSWVWFLLGGVGAVFCLGLTGCFIRNHRDRNKGGSGTFELGESEQGSVGTVETQYQSPLIT